MNDHSFDYHNVCHNFSVFKITLTLKLINEYFFVADVCLKYEVFFARPMVVSAKLLTANEWPFFCLS
jgi:hypothetical protein